MDAAYIPQVILGGLSIGSIYALIAVGLTISLNASGIVNACHGEFVVLSGLLTAFLFRTTELPLPIALLVALAVTTAAGLLVELTIVRTMRKARAMIITIVFATIAASYIFMGANRVGLGTDSVALSLSTITGTDVIWFLDMAVPLASLLALAVSTLVMLFLFYFYRRTKIGQAMLACSIDADAASLMGINVGAYTTLSFAFSAFLAGIAGVLITALASIKFDLGLSLLLKGFAGAVLGGMGNIGGAIVGALLIGQMESWGAAVIGGGYRDLVTFFIILLALIAFPRGLFRSHLVED